MLSIMSRIAHVEPFLHAELVLRVAELRLAHVDRARDADLARQLQPVIAHVGDDDEARPVVTGDDRRHQADGTRARYENVLGDDTELGRRVHRIAERVEDGGDVEVDRVVMRPHVARRHDDVLGEGAVALDADADRIRAQPSTAGQAVATFAAGDVSLGADELAPVERRHVLAQLRDLAHELVADDEAGLDGVLRPLVPGVDVEVRAADAGA
jgi:hypothetical protein